MVVLIAGLLVIQTVPFGRTAAPASAAAAELNLVADRVNASDPPLHPGQFRYVVTHAWSLGTSMFTDKSGNSTGPTLSLLVEDVRETWVPADPKQGCLIRDGTTGKYKWVNGSDEAARANGMELPTARTEERWERCLDHLGAWQVPTPEWLATLPRDPHQLYDLLRAATANRGNDPDLEMLVYVADALRGGLVPADLRAALYRALALVPALEITDRSANLDGRVGVGYGVSRAGFRQEMIIDPDTGQFIGERETTTRDMDDLKAGTVRSYTSVTTSVVDKAG